MIWWEWSDDDGARRWKTRRGAVPPMLSRVLSPLFLVAMVLGIVGGAAGALIGYFVDIVGGFLDWGLVLFGLAVTYASGTALIDFVKAGR